MQALGGFPYCVVLPFCRVCYHIVSGTYIYSEKKRCANMERTTHFLSVGMKLNIKQTVAAEAILLAEDNLNPPNSFSVTVSISTLRSNTSGPSGLAPPLWVDGLRKGTIFADHPRTITLMESATHQIEVAQSLESPSQRGAEYVALSNVWSPTASRSHAFIYYIYYLVQEKVMLGSFQAPPDLAAATNACCTRSRWVTSGSP